MARGQYGLSRACPLLHTPLRWMVGARQALAAKELQVPTRYFLDGSWAESRWFPRVVAGSATVFVVAALVAALMAEGSSLKRHRDHYESQGCTGLSAQGSEQRNRPQLGCSGVKVPARSHRQTPQQLTGPSAATGDLRENLAAVAAIALGAKPYARAGHDAGAGRSLHESHRALAQTALMD